MILGVILLLTIALPIAIVSGLNVRLYHDRIIVGAHDYKYVDVRVYKPFPSSEIAIKAYIYTTTGSGSDINIGIIRPDGGIQLLKKRYRGNFEYEFTAPMPGDYRVRIDNSDSEERKIVDLAIGRYRPEIITETETKTITIHPPELHTPENFTHGIEINTKELIVLFVLIIAILIIVFVAGFIIGKISERRTMAK